MILKKTIKVSWLRQPVPSFLLLMSQMKTKNDPTTVLQTVESNAKENLYKNIKNIKL